MAGNVNGGGGLIGGIIDAFSNIGFGAYDRQVEAMRYNQEWKFAQEQWAYKKEQDAYQRAYQKELNDTMMAREDNATQRRAVDLARAGMNPNLAVGQPAQASAGQAGSFNTSVNRPNSRPVTGNPLQGQGMQMYQAYMDAKRMQADLDQMRNQSNLMKAQSRYYDSLAEGSQASNAKTRAEVDTILYDFGLAQRTGTRYNSSGNPDAIIRAIWNVGDKLGFDMNNFVNSLGDLAKTIGDKTVGLFMQDVTDVMSGLSKEQRDGVAKYANAVVQSAKAGVKFSVDTFLPMLSPALKLSNDVRDFLINSGKKLFKKD